MTRQLSTKRAIGRDVVAALVALGIAGLLPLVADVYLLHLAIVTLILVVIASSWNLAAMTGQISLGHAGFFGLGAYAAALLHERWGVGVLLGMTVGALVAAAAAAAVGRVCLRIRGVYFAMATIAFAEAVKVLVIALPTVTRGAMGIGLPPLFSGDRRTAYALILGVVALLLATDVALRHSPWYYAVTAIREDEDAAGMLGVDPARFKIVTLVISAAFTALAGGFYAHYISFVEPSVVFGIQVSIESQIMPIVGGVYTLWGPVLGAVFLSALSEWLRSTLGEVNLLAYGIALVLAIRFMPGGLVGLLRREHGG